MSYNKIKICTMCDIRIPIHTGTIKCSTCNCWMCDKHSTEIKQYDNQCPSCWCSDDGCFLCKKYLNTIPE